MSMCICGFMVLQIVTWTTRKAVDPGCAVVPTTARNTIPWLGLAFRPLRIAVNPTPRLPQQPAAPRNQLLATVQMGVRECPLCSDTVCDPNSRTRCFSQDSGFAVCNANAHFLVCAFFVVGQGAELVEAALRAHPVFSRLPTMALRTLSARG